ncbi:MAG: ZIP family metal transporter [Candidatus Omnitrophica bacterium]|nr:ZIP family metal transporter [Candidatus Omnitrophota bacterium]
MSNIALGTIASVSAAMGSVLGASIVSSRIKIKDSAVSALLGIAAGVMLSVTCFSLIVPAFTNGGTIVVVLGIVAGALLLFIVDKTIPHEHQGAGYPDFYADSKAVTWLLCAAIIHNIPEGMAVGLGFMNGGDQGVALASGIGFQNILEGIVLASTLKMVCKPSTRIVGFVVVTTAIEPIMALMSCSVLTVVPHLTAFLLAFAAGAMLFIVSSEMVPESHGKGNERFATFGIIVGFVIMMVLNSVL